jgi:hypothetical protein
MGTSALFGGNELMVSLLHLFAFLLHDFGSVFNDRKLMALSERSKDAAKGTLPHCRTIRG